MRILARPSPVSQVPERSLGAAKAAFAAMRFEARRAARPKAIRMRWLLRLGPMRGLRLAERGSPRRRAGAGEPSPDSALAFRRFFGSVALKPWRGRKKAALAPRRPAAAMPVRRSVEGLPL